jgi:hypothetical protein
MTFFQDSFTKSLFLALLYILILKMSPFLRVIFVITMNDIIRDGHPCLRKVADLYILLEFVKKEIANNKV